jgi:hypothetical protein
MMIPPGQRWYLLASFNSGFIHSDGQNGSSVNEDTYEPLRKGLATLIGYRDGRVDIRPWTGSPNAGSQVALARQSRPSSLMTDDSTPRST